VREKNSARFFGWRLLPGYRERLITRGIGCFVCVGLEPDDQLVLMHHNPGDQHCEGLAVPSAPRKMATRPVWWQDASSWILGRCLRRRWPERGRPTRLTRSWLLHAEQANEHDAGKGSPRCELASLNSKAPDCSGAFLIEAIPRKNINICSRLAEQPWYRPRNQRRLGPMDSPRRLSWHRCACSTLWSCLFRVSLSCQR
jgi:hypothetical protein